MTRSEIGSSLRRAGSEPALSVRTRYFNSASVRLPVMMPWPSMREIRLGAEMILSSRTMASGWPMCEPERSPKRADPCGSNLKPTTDSPVRLSNSGIGAIPGPRGGRLPCGPWICRGWCSRAARICRRIPRYGGRARHLRCRPRTSAWCRRGVRRGLPFSGDRSWRGRPGRRRRLE
jgi:hypothetical protein